MGRACMRRRLRPRPLISGLPEISTMTEWVWLSSLSRPAHLAAVRRGNRDAGGGIFVELVAQRADRDAEDVGRVGAVAETVLERLQDQLALNVGDGAADQRAGDGLRRHR